MSKPVKTFAIDYRVNKRVFIIIITWDIAEFSGQNDTGH